MAKIVLPLRQTSEAQPIGIRHECAFNRRCTNRCGIQNQDKSPYRGCQCGTATKKRRNIRTISQTGRRRTRESRENTSLVSRMIHSVRCNRQHPDSGKPFGPQAVRNQSASGGSGQASEALPLSGRASVKPRGIVRFGMVSLAGSAGLRTLGARARFQASSNPDFGRSLGLRPQLSLVLAAECQLIDDGQE